MSDETETPFGKNAAQKSHPPDHSQEFSETRVKSQPSRAARRKPLDTDGRERPAFLLNFPEVPELERLIAAFERGDFKMVREQAPTLIASTKDDEVRAAAQQLITRTQPDPVLKLFLMTSLGLLLFVTLWVYW
jgi:hypothetical protein